MGPCLWYIGSRSKIPATVTTVFQAASLSKPVTAMAACVWCKAKLDLDADVNARLKSWQIPENEFNSRKGYAVQRLCRTAALAAGISRRERSNSCDWFSVSRSASFVIT